MTTDPADEIRYDCANTLAAWLPPLSTSLPGWGLDLRGLDREAGRLEYELRPYAPRLRDLPSRRFRVRIIVEEIAS